MDRNITTSNKTQEKSIIYAIVGLVIAVLVVVLIGWLALGDDKDYIQGQVEASEYRVSSKVTGRVIEIRVKEGDHVKRGDTLAIIYAPEVQAKLTQAQGAKNAASALDEMAKAGTRKEQVTAAYQVLQQAKAGQEIAEKTYHRLQKLYDEGVVSEQKKDEAFASYKAMEAQVFAAQSQYDMALRGAREEEKIAMQAQTERAQGAVDEVNSYINETIQTATVDGEVSEIYPNIGELIAAGSPIMSILDTNDIWGVFNVREDKLQGLAMGDEITAYVPAFDKNITLKVFYIKDQGSFAIWRATKDKGQYDLRTFEVKAKPKDKEDRLIPGMSLVVMK